MMRRLFIVILGACFVAGCRVDQAREIRVYRDVIDLPATRPSTRPGVATLPEVLRLANTQSQELAQQGEVFYRVVNERRRAIAAFLPTINFNPTYSRRDPTDTVDNTPNGGSIGGNTAGAQDRALDAPLDLNINLFNGFADVHRYWSTTFRIEQAKQTLLDTQQTLLLDVANLYYAVLISEASLHVIEQSLAAQEERLRDTRGRFDAGLARPLDVSQTEAQVSQTRVQLIDARRSIATGRVALSQLAATKLNDVVLADGFDVPEAEPSLDSAIAEAFIARNDLLAAEAAVLAAQREVKVAVAQYYPSITLDVSRFLYRESIPDDRRWDAILGANLPIFAAGRIRADVLEAWSFYREAQIVRQRVGLQVTADVETALIEFQASTERLAELKQQLRASEEAFSLAEQSYRAGIATNLDRLIAQSTLLTAQLAYSQEFFSRKLRYLNLLRVTGQLRRGLESWQ